MTNRFFSYFMPSAAPHILQSSDSESYLSIQHLENISEPCLLRVATTQQACLVQNAWRSPIYDAGEHTLSLQTLTALNPQLPLAVMFITPKNKLQRTWQHQKLQLHGQYQLRILQTELFLKQLLNLAPALELRHLDQWLAQQFETIIQEHQVPQQDLQDYSQRLALFLKDVLNSYILDAYGIVLEELTLHYAHTLERNPEALIPSPTPEVQPSEIALEAKDLTAEAPLEFYCALNGEQQGPYSHYGIQELIDNGKISAHTLIWKLGQPSWQALKQFTEFNIPESHSHDND